MIKLQLEIAQGLAQQILAARLQDSRHTGTRGWQSLPQRGQPYAWFDSTFQQVVDALGQTPDTWWFNVHEKSQRTNWHDHPNYPTVAVLYIQADHATSAIEFREGEGYWNEQPRTGDLLVFSGRLAHRVLPNASVHPRISVAFNLNGKYSIMG